MVAALAVSLALAGGTATSVLALTVGSRAHYDYQTSVVARSPPRRNPSPACASPATSANWSATDGEGGACRSGHRG